MELIRHLSTVDLHVGGQPLRVITGGPYICKGETMADKSRFFTRHFDWIRQMLMKEPRGHSAMQGCILTEPTHEDARFGLVFMDHQGVGAIPGHGIIAAVTAMIETGLIADAVDRTKVIVDVPGGQVQAYAECSGENVKSVSFTDGAFFTLATGVPLKAFNLDISIDLAYGDVVYAVVDARQLGLAVEIQCLTELRKWCKSITEDVETRSLLGRYPVIRQPAVIGGVIFTDDPRKTGSRLRSVTISADGQIDRSAYGRGLSAPMAVMYKKGMITVGQEFMGEGIAGSQACGRIVETVGGEGGEGIHVRIKGRAFITGTHQFIVDPGDPFQEGFLLQ